MFEELSDGELVVLWHRLNQGLAFFDDYKNRTTADIETLTTIDKKYKSKLWENIDKECNERRIDPIKGTITEVVEVINYVDQEKAIR